MTTIDGFAGYREPVSWDQTYDIRLFLVIEAPFEHFSNVQHFASPPNVHLWCLL
jgi:hypothetical protein